jgi:anti-sigma regulatory factor (Ser/Thr protein kinase)
MPDDVELAPTAQSVSLGRNYVRQRCMAAGLPGKAADAVLLASEVITNALKYAGTSMTVTVTNPEDGAIRVAVRDGERKAPVRRTDRRGIRSGGRGLLLLDELATRWGVTQDRGGKTVWFEV